MYAIRMQDRSNPYSQHTLPCDNVFAMQRPAGELEVLSKAMQPKSFGAFKR
jgi:hypothetical protein